MCQRCFPLRSRHRIQLLLLFMILRMSSLCIYSALSRTSLRVVDAIGLACASLGLQWPVGVRAQSSKRISSSWAQSGRVSISHICMVSPHCPPLPGYNLTVLALQAWIFSAKLFLSFDQTFAKCLHSMTKCIFPSLSHMQLYHNEGLFIVIFITDLIIFLLQPMYFKNTKKKSLITLIQ